MRNVQNVVAFIVSFAAHGVVLVALAMLQINLMEEQTSVLLETVFSEEREQQEFSRELEEPTEMTDAVSFIPGGVVSTVVGATTGPTVSQTKIQTSESLKEPDIQVNAGEITLPGNDMLGEDLGQGEVSGEAGAIVSGYGAAMDQITLELVRLMREQQVLVVWLFDESESMKDDQKRIRGTFQKVYHDLGIVSKQDEQINKKSRKSDRVSEEVLLTAIHSFGKDVHAITAAPTADIKAIQEAIDKIPIDNTGDENLCQSIAFVIDKYRVTAARQKRKLVLVVVSDESGDDGVTVQETIQKATRADCPIYILGREAVFGYPYAHVRWQDPKYKLWHWIRIRRGPETAYAECLQYDGLGARYDSFSSGFGPYEQVRLAKETGGVYFLLPGEEQNLTGPGAHDQRRFRDLDMKEYRPLLIPRPEYEKERNASKFRKAIWDVIVLLNPHLDNEISVRERHYAINPEKFRDQGKPEFQKAIRSMGLLNQASQILTKIKPLRDQEASQRWRAAYDLAYAQCLSYRVRLFQYMLALDQHNKEKPHPKNKNKEGQKSNEWWVRRTKKMLEPDAEQIKITKVDMTELKAQENRARELYQYVIAQHPGTPWAQRANYEMGQGFGIEFYDLFYDPRHYEVKTPKF